MVCPGQLAEGATNVIVAAASLEAQHVIRIALHPQAHTRRTEGIPTHEEAFGSEKDQGRTHKATPSHQLHITFLLPHIVLRSSFEVRK